MKNLTEEEFNDIVANGKMFQLTDGQSELFFGTQKQFADCFFSNADYLDVCGFAEKNGYFVVAAKQQE